LQESGYVLLAQGLFAVSMSRLVVMLCLWEVVCRITYIVDFVELLDALDGCEWFVDVYGPCVSAAQGHVHGGV